MEGEEAVYAGFALLLTERRAVVSSRGASVQLWGRVDSRGTTLCSPPIHSKHSRVVSRSAPLLRRDGLSICNSSKLRLRLGRDGVFDLLDLQPGNSDVERFCNAVAAEVLIPSLELHDS